MMAFACTISILKCFFFILLHFFVGVLPDWLQAICHHYFSVSAVLHCLIQCMPLHNILYIECAECHPRS